MHRRSNETRFLVVALVIAAFGVSVVAADGAGDSVVSRSDLERALAERASQDEASRQAILDLLERPEVREMTEGLGLDRVRASAAVASLDGEELQALAGLAEQLDSELAGGQASGKMTGGTGKYLPILYGVAVLALLLVLILT